MRKRLLALGASAVLLLVAACSGGGDGGTSATGTSGGDGGAAGVGGADTLTLGEIAIPASWDVDGYSISHQVGYFTAVFDTLIRQDGEGTLVPGLATEWVYDDARTQLTLTLREGVTFTDGAAFDADAVVANVEHFQASATADLSNAQYISGVEATDATHVVLTLSAPDPMLTTWLTGSLGYMASPDSFDAADVKTNPVGTGPYVLDTAQTVTGSSYVFTKNPDYWDDSFHVYSTLTIKYFADQTALLNAYLGKQLDAGTYQDYTNLAQLESSGLQLIYNQLDVAGLLLLDRDGTIEPALADVKVRQALNMAIDKEGILQALYNGEGTVTSSWFGASTAGFDESLDDTYTYDPDAAKALLAEAGYGDGFTLSMPTTSGLPQSVFTTIQSQLGEIGVTVNYTDVGTNFITDLLSAKFGSSFMYLATANDWQFAQLALVPNATFNPFGTQSDEADALLATIQTGTDDEAAAAAKELNAFTVDNAWFAPFFRINNYWVHTDAVDVTMAKDNTSPYIYLIQPAA